ncbi:late embryogenesis abundant protein At5g17165-like [Miscanthus floridulus]|uniref:late embryogenesis abundant protein At5g17165-like n=1 Tax=Miscanthus floridulus TaxID=154761 RepID=UPI00345989AA
MAAAASSKGRAIAGSFVSRVLAGKAASPKRAVHASAYDKNLEEQVRPAFVPDDVIGGAGNPDKYWSPHPKTGVFGPAAVDPKLAAAGAPDAAANAAGGTVLDEKVWFRPLEDVEKPPPVA